MTPSTSSLPKVVTIVLGAILGVFTGLVHVFGWNAPFPELVQFVAILAGTYGVNIITGPQFENLFNLPPAGLMFIAMAIGGAQITAPFWHMSGAGLGIVQGVCELLLSLGFGMAVTPAAAARSTA